ncbi:MAG TPA: Dabb family protein, partial [Protaetiibacter sp.]|nr:Dabb family protein [Protaetiibacter sp.]
MGANRAEQRAADAEGVRQRLEALRGVVPAERIEVGIDLGATEGNWHVVLVSDFATADDLAAYQTHPQHVQAAAFIRSVAADR